MDEAENKNDAPLKPTQHKQTATDRIKEIHGIRPLLPVYDQSEAIKDQERQPILNYSIPPSGLNGHRRFNKNKRRLPQKFFLKLALAVAVIALLFGAWDAWQLYHKVNHLAVGNLTPSVNGQENILVAGSTNRCNLKVQNAQWGFCSQGVTGINSDVIFVIHLDPATKHASLLSIPRDTFVPNARSDAQAFKIDAALYEGPTQLVKAIEEDFGIPIQHYVEVGFDGFVNIVNAVGGVRMYFPMAVYDSESHLDIKTPGCKLLNGVEALQVIRARHLQYKGPGITTNDVNYWPQETQSDIARITRSHEFLRVLASTVQGKGLANPITDQKLIDAIAPQVQVDSGLSVGALMQLMNTFRNVGVNSMPQATLPISLTNFGSYYYGGYNYGDVVFPTNPQDMNAIDQFLGIDSSTNPLNGKPLPKPSSFKVSVINGSGIAYQATNIGNDLSKVGFNLSGQAGSSTPLSNQATETFVYYNGPTSEADAITVANHLSGSVILANDASQVTPGSQVTVLTGSNTAVMGVTSITSQETPATGQAPSALAKPTTATQSLAPWDPRACPKQG